MEDDFIVINAHCEKRPYRIICDLFGWSGVIWRTKLSTIVAHRWHRQL